MVVGNIISLTELWNQRLDNLVKRYLDKSVDSCKEWAESLGNWIKYSELKNKGDGKEFQEEEFQIKTNDLENKTMGFLWNYVKRGWTERFRNRFIYIGISLIIIGAIILILGIWL